MVQHLRALVHAVWGIGLSQNCLRSRLVSFGIEHETPTLINGLNGPAGKDARHLGDVGLRVATVDAQRVQLHQLTSVIFVEAFIGISRGWRRLAGLHARSW